MGDDESTQTGINKSDIEHLKGKVDDLEKSVDKLRDNTPTKENFKDLEDTIRKVLLEGNGDKPLTIRVAQNQSKIKNNQSRISRMYGAIGAVGLLVLGSLSDWLFKWLG